VSFALPETEDIEGERHLPLALSGIRVVDQGRAAAFQDSLDFGERAVETALIGDAVEDGRPN
jgi:hypothetical protein